MYIIYELEISHQNVKSDFDNFMTYFRSILHNYEENNRFHNKNVYSFQPIYFLLLNEDDPFSQEEYNEYKVLKEFYVHEYEYQEDKLKLSIFMLNKFHHDENDIFESWLLHITRQFPELHIYLYYYHIYYKNEYDDDVCYIYLHNNRMIDT